MPDRSNGRYEVINPPNRLRAKVGYGHGIDPRAASRAEATLAKEKTQSDDWANEYLAAMHETIDALDGRRGQRQDHIAKLFRVSHELRGVGGTVGYPLVTGICANLCRYLDGLPAYVDAEGEVLRAHTDALRAVIHNKVAGEGGSTGAELVAELQALVAD
ncbi:MAG: Hpt domain-containing protein [Alphaproteobacteria bacterium]